MAERVAKIVDQTNGEKAVIFGFLDGDEIRVSHRKGVRHYANQKNAMKAAVRWTTLEK